MIGDFTTASLSPDAHQRVFQAGGLLGESCTRGSAGDRRPGQTELRQRVGDALVQFVTSHSPVVE